MAIKKIEATGKVDKEGLLTITRMDSFLKHVGNEYNSKYVTITVQPKKKVRTNKQLAFYFGVCLVMIQERLKETQGKTFSILQIDEDLRSVYLYKEDINLVTGEVIKRNKTLKEMDGEASTTDVMLLIDGAMDFGGLIDIQIPEPDPNWRINKNQ